MSRDRTTSERITLTRSAVLELCREARAHGYAWGRSDEHRAQWEARLTGTAVAAPVDQFAFVAKVMAAREDVLPALWRDMQAARDEKGDETR
ncbi:hypothetical protein [Amycolatopsis sp. NPDC051903]|uniref:hypothetical protein n=1 Tax=Amycolatopsis sp. NPDC051903 TaxID=3363936 RepID=UPI00379F164F